MGLALPPVYGKSKFYEKKKAKALKIIEKQKSIIAECDKHIPKVEDEK